MNTLVGLEGSDPQPLKPSRTLFEIVTCLLVFTGHQGLATGSKKQGLVYVGDMEMSVGVQSLKHTEGGWGVVCLCTLDVQTVCFCGQSCCLQPVLASGASRACPGLTLLYGQWPRGELQDSPLSGPGGACTGGRDQGSWVGWAVFSGSGPCGTAPFRPFSRDAGQRPRVRGEKRGSRPRGCG